MVDVQIEQVVTTIDVALGNQVVTVMYNASKAVKNHHWNFIGRDFFPYHKTLDKVYDYLLDSADIVAERIRRLGGVVNPQAVEDNNQVVGLVRDRETILAIRDILNDVIEGVKALRATVDERETGIQSEFDAVIDAGQQLLWFWSSAN